MKKRFQRMRNSQDLVHTAIFSHVDLSLSLSGNVQIALECSHMLTLSRRVTRQFVIYLNEVDFVPPQITYRYKKSVMK